MTKLTQLLSPDRICLGADITSKKKALQTLAQLLAGGDDRLDVDTTFAALTAREKLGSTAMEHGIAIPHCRVDHCQQPRTAILTAQEGIAFDSHDGHTTDVLWALIVPTESTNDHLKILALLAEMLQKKTTREKIRVTADSTTLYRNLCQIEQHVDEPTL